MPTYCYRAPDGQTYERLFKLSERPDVIDTPSGHAVRVITGVQRTSLGWATFEFGVNGQWDNGLGQRVESSKHIDSVLRTKNLARADKAHVEAGLEQADKLDAHRKLLHTGGLDVTNADGMPLSAPSSVDLPMFQPRDADIDKFHTYSG